MKGKPSRQAPSSISSSTIGGQASSRWAVPTPFSPPPTELDYYSRKQSYDTEFSNLSGIKSRLVFELSRIPAVGAKSLKRGHELEAELDDVEGRIGALKRQMRIDGVL